jgi:hypothetical protein
MGIQTLGTEQPNRLPGCSIISDREMKKQKRGNFQKKSTTAGCHHPNDRRSKHL